MTSAQSPKPQNLLILKLQGGLDMIGLSNFTDDETRTSEVKWLGGSHIF